MPHDLQPTLTQLLLSSLLIILHIHGVLSVNLLDCSNDATNYTTNSPFQSNLNLLLTFLFSSTSPTSFSNNIQGEAPNEVYGLALCTADLSPQECQNCLNNSVSEIVRQCPRGKSAAIWNNACLLLYSDQDFFSTASTSKPEIFYNIANVTDPNSFNQLLGGLMDNLIKKAAHDSSVKFAAEAVNFTNFRKLYGMVLCRGDLSNDVCDQCLRDFVGDILTYCNGKEGAAILGLNCFLRFELYPFYNVSAVTALSSETSPPASPNTNPTRAPPYASTTNNDDENNRTLKLILIIAIPPAAMVVLVSTICVYFQRKKNAKGLIISDGGDVQEIKEVDLLFDFGISLELLQIISLMQISLVKVALDRFIRDL